MTCSLLEFAQSQNDFWSPYGPRWDFWYDRITYALKKKLFLFLLLLFSSESQNVL